MRVATVLCVLLLIVLAGVPLLLGGASEREQPGDRRLIIVTPHVQQIRTEFARAFRDWHARRYPDDPPVYVDFRSPGGTSEIIRVLQAQYNAAITAGRIAPDGSCEPGTIGYDLMFGGGTYDHGRLAAGEGVRVTPSEGADPVALPMSVPVGFSQVQLDEWFPVRVIGTQPLVHEDQRWIGTALSSFGIVYNRQLVRNLLGKNEIESFDDLADPRLFGWVAMADPRQSGSLSTTLDSILSKYGWDAGWALLRRIAANSRSFVASSARPPLDVSQGEAAAALAIDFYGRAQGQAILAPGQSPEHGRVGYVDPPGATYIDPDPISILRGGPEPELAQRFVEFVLTREGQALWNFRSHRTLEASHDLPRPPSVDGTPDGAPLGPIEYELRRLPILPAMYDAGTGDLAYMVDTINPYDIASDAAPRGWRSAIGPMMGAFAIDSPDQIRAAWQALNRVRADPDAPPTLVVAMEARFDAMPTGPQVRATYESIFGIERPGADAAWPADDQGRPLPLTQAFPHLAPWEAFQDFTPDTYRAVRATWRNPTWAARLQVVYTQVFRENQAAVVDMERQWRSAGSPAAGVPAAAGTPASPTEAGDGTSQRGP
ncbi:MAG: extracellular solute-binding protein [Phycisphaerales bacterium]|nr:extracellular solute-binding protein [Phycisphaerales bacterium]MCB9841390.1 extracellular solute-binding protein [Phycisphaeraceae bacterium]